MPGRISFSTAIQSPGERGYFGGRKRAMASRTERTQLQIPNTNAFQLLDGMARLKESVAQGVSARLG